jgi:glutathione S-transferase
MEAELEKNPWFVGPDFSAADIQMSFPIEAGQARGMVSSDRPRLVDFLKRIHARPAYQRALERGGPYQLMS